MLVSNLRETLLAVKPKIMILKKSGKVLGRVEIIVCNASSISYFEKYFSHFRSETNFLNIFAGTKIQMSLSVNKLILILRKNDICSNHCFGESSFFK